MANDSNEFQVDSVFDLSVDETSVTGHVAKGAFRSGEMVSFTSASGIPLLAPITRIGSAETPVNIVREGQKTSMVLKVEPQHLVPGATFTSSGEEESYAATMIVDTGKVAQAQQDTAAVINPELIEIERLVNNRQFEDAQQRVQAFLGQEPNSSGAHRLMARIHLEADFDLQDKKKALEHIKTAYENSGGADADVLETLAQALGANGEVPHGLRYLERLHSQAADLDNKKYFANRIAAYRKRYKIPDVWEFVDGFGDVVFESGSPAEVVKAIQNGSIPDNAKVRINKIGELMDIEDTLAKEHPEIGALYRGSSFNPVLDMSLGVGAGLVLGIGLSIGVGFSAIVGIVGGAIIGAGLGFAIARQRSQKA